MPKKPFDPMRDESFLRDFFWMPPRHTGAKSSFWWPFKAAPAKRIMVRLSPDQMSDLADGKEVTFRAGDVTLSLSKNQPA